MTAAQRVNQVSEHECFGCGDLNPIGLRLKFWKDDAGVCAEFTPAVVHQGYIRLTHGGIISTLLDEAMSWAVIESGRLAVTAKMAVQFRAPVPVGERLQIRGRVARDRGRVVETEGEIRSENDRLLVSATASFVRVTAEQQQEWEATYLIGDSERQGG